MAGIFVIFLALCVLVSVLRGNEAASVDREREDST